MKSIPAKISAIRFLRLLFFSSIAKAKNDYFLDQSIRYETLKIIRVLYTSIHIAESHSSIKSRSKVSQIIMRELSTSTTNSNLSINDYTLTQRC